MGQIEDIMTVLEDPWTLQKNSTFIPKLEVIIK